MEKDETTGYDNPEQWSDERLRDEARKIAAIALARNVEIPLPFIIHNYNPNGIVRRSSNERITLPYSRESLQDQLSFVQVGTQNVIDVLNQYRQDKIPPITSENLDDEFRSWFSYSLLSYGLTAQKAKRDIQATLYATPNVAITKDEFIKLAEDFGAGQPHRAIIDKEQINLYADEQLSRTEPDNERTVLFRIAFDSFAPELKKGTAKQQQDQLSVLQAHNQHFAIASPLDVMTELFTRRAHGDKLAETTTADKTRTVVLPTQTGQALEIHVNFEGELAITKLGANDKRQSHLILK